MIPEVSPTLPSAAPRAVTLARVVHLSAVVFCGVLPAVTLVALFAGAIQEDVVAFDFRVFYAAAEALLRGETPYQSVDNPAAVVARGYVYPPLTAIGAIPFTVLPPEAAGLVVMALFVAATVAIPFVLGVRDWRCYGLLFLWPPILSGIQTGSVTILLALGTAVAWRLRDRPIASAACIGVTLAVKLILWPLGIWLAATRRIAAAALSYVAAVLLVLGSWAVVGFVGLTEYPDVLRRLQDVVELDAYTVYVVALDLGASPSLARGVWLVVGLLLVASVVVVGRRGTDRSAFILAIAAALALSPIVWLHYFALLAVVVAVAQPKLGVAWFVPLAMVVTPGSGNAAPFETATTLAVAALTVGLALRASRDQFVLDGVRPTGSDPSLTSCNPSGSEVSRSPAVRPAI